MLRVGFDQGRLSLTTDLLARDGLDSPALSSCQKTFRKTQRFQPIEDLVAALDKLASATDAA